MKGRRHGPNDLLIVATAHNAVLVNHNSREFTRITNLRWVGWEGEGQNP
jgi:tRNA(fMet)-specific endonuclease VapC